MDLPDKSNPQKRVPKQAVVPKGAAKPVSRTASRRFMDHVFAESPKTLLGTVAKNVIEPRIKQGLEEAFNSFIHGMFWGNGGSPSLGIQRGTVLRGGGVVINPTDYNAISSQTPAVQAASVSGNMTGPYKDLTFPSQEFAERVLASLISDINQYRVTTVADLYEAANLTPDPAHGNFGWYGMEGARLVREGSGVKLMLPRPVRM